MLKFKCSDCGHVVRRKPRRWFTDAQLTCVKCQTYGSLVQLLPSAGREDKSGTFTPSEMKKFLELPSH